MTYLNTEHPGTAEYDSSAMSDVYCENDKGAMSLVEMQHGEQQFFRDRNLFYSIFPIRGQAVKAEHQYFDYDKIE